MKRPQSMEIAKIIEENGGRLYLVGGAVRDKIMGRKSYDEDYCVTGLSSEEFSSLFPMAKLDGKALLRPGRGAGQPVRGPFGKERQREKIRRGSVFYPTCPD